MDPIVTREVTVDAPLEDVWEAVTDEATRADWLAEDGADRPLQVEETVERERITWRWGPDEDGPASTVTITLRPHDDGTTGVHVVERLLAPAARASVRSAGSLRASASAVLAGAAWDRRLLGLELCLVLGLARV